MSSPGFVELTQAEYESIRHAKRCQLIVLGIEDKFDLLLANYAEYEQALLELTLHQMVYRNLDWSSFQTDLQLVNRRLANLLSAARLYLDQASHDLGGLQGPESDIGAALDEERSRQYEGKIGFRAMEAARNYAQHRSLPVHQLSYPKRVEEPGVPSSKISFGAVPSLDTAQLEVDGGFKASVLAELKERGQHVPITPLVREYVEGLGEVQERLRTISDPHVDVWEDTLRRVKERAREAFPDHLIGLAVVAEQEEGIWPEIDHIFSDPWDRRKELRRKNALLKNLADRYVTSKVQG